MTSREQFEAWFENDVVEKKVTFPAFEDGEYTEGDLYDDQLYFMLQAMWMAWQAASKASEQQLAAVVAELSAIEAIHNDAVFITDEHYEQCPPEVQKMIGALAALRIPAYDAYLVEVRAQGVEMAMEHMQSSGSLTFGDCYISLNKFAAQLRQGAAL